MSLRSFSCFSFSFFNIFNFSLVGFAEKVILGFTTSSSTASSTFATGLLISTASGYIIVLPVNKSMSNSLSSSMQSSSSSSTSFPLSLTLSSIVYCRFTSDLTFWNRFSSWRIDSSPLFLWNSVWFNSCLPNRYMTGLKWLATSEAGFT